MFLSFSLSALSLSLVLVRFLRSAMSPTARSVCGGLEVFRKPCMCSAVAGNDVLGM